MSAHPLTVVGVVGGLAGFWVGEPLIAVFGLGLAVNQIVIERVAMKHSVEVDCTPPRRQAGPAKPPKPFDEADIWRTPAPADGPIARPLWPWLIGAASGSLVTAPAFMLARLAS